VKTISRPDCPSARAEKTTVLNLTSLTEEEKINLFVQLFDEIAGNGRGQAVLKALEHGVRKEPGNGSEVPEPLDIRKIATESPPPRDWVIQNLLPAKVVGVLAGPSGAGKSFFLLHLAVHVAAGLIGGPFEILKAQPVVVLNAEDPPDELARRLYWTLRPYQKLTEVLAKNLYVYAVAGEMGALARYGPHNNPEISEDYQKLEAIIKQKQPRLVILDTFSRFYGLNENSNDEVAFWLGLLERLARHHGTAFLICHHQNKSGLGSRDVTSFRGAGALVANSRFAWILKPLSDEELINQGLKLVLDTRFFQISFEKMNYGPKPAPILFKQAKDAAPEWIEFNPTKRLVQIIADAVIEAGGERGLSEREIRRSKKFKNYLRDYGITFSSIVHKLEDLLKEAATVGLLEKVEIITKGRPKEVFRGPTKK